MAGTDTLLSFFPHASSAPCSLKSLSHFLMNCLLNRIPLVLHLKIREWLRFQISQERIEAKVCFLKLYAQLYC
jgi:hypothetical protein